MQARQTFWLSAVLLCTSACTSSSFEGVDIDFSLRVQGPPQAQALTLDGDEILLERVALALADIKLIACPEPVAARWSPRRLVERLVPVAHAHGVNTPISNGTPYALIFASEASQAFDLQRAFYPADGTSVCSVQLLFEPLDSDAEFIEDAPELQSARCAVQHQGGTFSSGGRDRIEIALDAPQAIEGGSAYTLTLRLDGSLDGGELTSADGSPAAQADAVFDAVLSLISLQLEAH